MKRSITLDVSVTSSTPLQVPTFHCMFFFSRGASFYAGVFEKIGVEPQGWRIGKYKSFGDQFTRNNISKENREVLTTILDNIYENWVDKISQAKGEVTLCFPLLILILDVSK
ncbi:putative peptidase S49 [Helianthus annuus]|nr:putative peptidase S49 [Helianthus annuus]